ncbi:MAG: hypothetical protein U0132_00600 [Gemmatimonadaceae bacterium]
MGGWVSLCSLGIAACFSSGEPLVSGAQKCQAPADGTPSFGCAVLTGSVVGPADEPLDGISGAIRSTPQCACRSVAIVVDTTGMFTITVHRALSAPTSSPDTATVIVYMGATAAKYPRSITGDAFFDTASVLMTYAPVGGEAQVYNLRLQIPLPPRS